MGELPSSVYGCPDRPLPGNGHVPMRTKQRRSSRPAAADDPPVPLPSGVDGGPTGWAERDDSTLLRCPALGRTVTTMVWLGVSAK